MSEVLMREIREKAKNIALKWLLEDFLEGQFHVESWEDMENISGLDGIHLEQMIEVAIEAVLDGYACIKKEQLQKLLDELTSDEVKKKSWNVWVREFVAFQKARELIEQNLGVKGKKEPTK